MLLQLIVIEREPSRSKEIGNNLMEKSFEQSYFFVLIKKGYQHINYYFSQFFELIT